MGGAGVSDDVMCVCARGGSVSFGRPGIVGGEECPRPDGPEPQIFLSFQFNFKHYNTILWKSFV